MPDKKQTITTPEGLKPKLVEWLKKHHAKIEIEHHPKQRSIYKISFDQGVFKGENVYTVRYDRLTPMFLAQICFSEGWNNQGRIEDALLKALEIET